MLSVFITETSVLALFGHFCKVDLQVVVMRESSLASLILIMWEHSSTTNTLELPNSLYYCVFILGSETLYIYIYIY